MSEVSNIRILIHEYSNNPGICVSEFSFLNIDDTK